MNKNIVSRLLVSIILGAFVATGFAMAGTSKAKRSPAANSCISAAKSYADFAAAETDSPVCAKTSVYKAKGYTNLQIADNCAADFAKVTKISTKEDGVFTVNVANVAFLVSCTYTSDTGAAEEDQGCHCQTAAAD